jgi:hypothetical protein
MDNLLNTQFVARTDCLYHNKNKILVVALTTSRNVTAITP